MKRRFTTIRERPAPGTQAVVRALAILKAFDGTRAEWRLNDLATELALHKTTVFRLLGALERDGFLSRDADRQSYRLGPDLIALGTQALRSTDLHAAAHPVLRSLAIDTGEAATLEVLVGEDVLILDEVHGRFLVGSSPEIGTRWPAHAASTGKVLLAAARFDDGTPERSGAPRGRLARLAPNTITSRARLDRELAQVWQRGFAVGTEEIEHGFTALGAPVRNFEGRTIAAISVGGPSARVSEARIPALARLVREAADRISERLGATGPKRRGASASAARAPRVRAARQSKRDSAAPKSNFLSEVHQ